MMIGLLFASQATATYQDTLKRFETKENAICKSERLVAEGGFSPLPKPTSYKSYRINDIEFNQARIIVLNAMYNDGIGIGSGFKEVADGIYSDYASYNGKVYYADFDKIGKYTADVCIVVRPQSK